jgi:hypothetical protein
MTALAYIVYTWGVAVYDSSYNENQDGRYN